MDSRQDSRRLSARDALWMAQEDASQPMHGGLILHYAGHLSREALMQLIVERLPLVPRFRQRLVFAPFGIAEPSWEDDPTFAIRDHVKELTLPAPADDRVLAEVVGTLHARRIDRTRPVWEITLLHGRPDDTTVVYFKMHHAAADAPALMQLLSLLHGPAPEAATAAEPARPQPGLSAQLGGAVQDRLTELATLGTDLAGRLQPATWPEQSRQLAALGGLGLSLLEPQPPMPWNGPLSTERRLAWTDMPFEPVRALAKRLGGTINDVALTILAGGLGRYLRQHGYATAGLALRDMVTVNVRRPEERDGLGNHVTGVFAPLYVGIDDPLERFAAEQAAMDRVKAQGLATIFDGLGQYAALIPPLVWQVAALPRPPLPQLPSGLRQPALVHLFSTNVAGPRERLSLGGHHLLRWQSAGICMLNTGLFVVVQSYADTFGVCVTVDPTKIRDEWVLIDHIASALDELEGAAAPAAV